MAYCVCHAPLKLMIRGAHGILCMPCSSQIISVMLSEIRTMENCYSVHPVIHFEKYNSPSKRMQFLKRTPPGFCRQLKTNKQKIKKTRIMFRVRVLN